MTDSALFTADVWFSGSCSSTAPEALDDQVDRRVAAVLRDLEDVRRRA